jgi:hypothetical protein
LMKLVQRVAFGTSELGFPRSSRLPLVPSD